MDVEYVSNDENNVAQSEKQGISEKHIGQGSSVGHAPARHTLDDRKSEQSLSGNVVERLGNSIPLRQGMEAQYVIGAEDMDVGSSVKQEGQGSIDG